MDDNQLQGLELSVDEARKACVLVGSDLNNVRATGTRAEYEVSYREYVKAHDALDGAKFSRDRYLAGKPA